MNDNILYHRAWIRRHVSCTHEALFQASSGSLPGSSENLTNAIVFKKRIAESQKELLVSIANGYTDGVDSIP